MTLIINIETSTTVCSVALSRDEELLALKESNEQKSHASMLTVFIDEVLKENRLTANELDAVAVSKGPGSYTGLRIGVSTAKGIAYARNLPLIAVNTLQAMALGMSKKIKKEQNLIKENTLLCPMIDARRMEVYTALYDAGNNLIKDVSAEIIDEDSFKDQLSNNQILFFGDGAEKCANIIRHPNASFISHFHPSARYMSQLTHNAFKNNNFVNVAYFEPFYLKDFVATTPRKNLLK